MLPVRVVLADDEPLLLAGLRTVLEAGGAITVVGQAEDGRGLLRAVDEHRPDVVLADVQMPGMTGLEALRVLCARPDAPPAAVLTTFDLDEYVTEALGLGVQGFLLKDADPEVLVRAVRDLAAGGAVLDPRITARLLPKLAAGPPPSPPRLSLREQQVLRGLAAGESNAAIGCRLGLAEATVKKYVSALLNKVGADNRVQAALLAQGWGVG
ncbi:MULTISPECIES: response regulator transcription factor [unclassified Pseudonocardia]|jgi:DNA-binding NarL/FixJ family response regulator|uniref:response regulator transcription factor n=1 Tax=unclassified Pseudonocardia TaxID=2619320 RepID=UPI000959C409|nr:MULTISPECIES: response regulator transcription factor [unclassified Pseudonocardia]MBN9103227.1 response regulator transcription factor [Pseudonocardia sp.]OJY38860.1 MAG: DNA-binding response regulator [Pseudonocardia sp. 73-21]